MTVSLRRVSKRAYRPMLAALVAAPLAVVSAAGPARAADTVTCGSAALVMAVDTGGVMWRYRLDRPDTPTPTWSPKVQIGRGWSGFGRVLGGPGGRVYGINAQGVHRYRYNGSAWESPTRITTSWTAYATAAYRNRITVDERGDFYLVDGTGRLRWSRYDEQAQKWTVYNSVLATGWDRFDLIVAGTAGTLYARQPDGKLFRHRFDPASQRWLEQNRSVGSGWQAFGKGIMSAGGDTLFGLTTGGAVHHYRFREDNGTWAIGGTRIGSGWQSYPNVTAATDACRLTADHTPPAPALSYREEEPVAAAQAGSDHQSPGPLHFAYTDRTGTLFTGSTFPFDPSIVWTPEPGTVDYTGRPTLLGEPDGTVRTFVQQTGSELALRAPSSSGGYAWTNLAGAMVATPVPVKLSDGRLAVFGVDAGGSPWHRRTDDLSGHLLPWTRLDGSGLTGALSAVAVTERAVVLTATDSRGAVVTARYQDGVLTSPWASMGSGSFADAPTPLVLPGPAVQVFARRADGRIAVQRIGSDGTYPGEWRDVGDDALRGTGSPAVLLQEPSARIVVLSRDGDRIVHARETVGGGGVWGATQPATPEGAVRSDPVALEYQDGAHQGFTTLSFVVRNASGGVSHWIMSDGTQGRSGSAAFVERKLPAAR